MRIVNLGVPICVLFLSLYLIYSPAIWAQDTQPMDQPKVILPAAPAQPDDESLPIIDRVYIDRVKILNNTIFSANELEKVTGAYTKRKLSFEDLEELRNQINLYYISKGYINSGVILPDQKIEAGSVVFKAIEGRITEIEIEDPGRLKPSYIRKRIALGTGPPLNLNKLQERLQILDENPLIRKIDAQLDPGDSPGEATLKIDVEEDTPYYVALSVSNHLSPGVGGEVLEVEAAHNNVIGWGDSLLALFGVNEGIRNVTVRYSLPITARDTVLSLFYNAGDSSVVESPFDEIDIESDETHYGISLFHPFINNTRNQLRVGLQLEKIGYKSSLLGRPFSFSRGVVDGESHATVLRFTQEWILRSSSQVTAFSSAFSLGLETLGADHIEPYSDFLMWIGQFQWIRKLSKPLDGQLLFRADFQFTDDPLLPYERFTIGGMNSVRGYRKDELVRDRGAFVSMEYRHPLLTLKIPKISREKDDGLLQSVLFADWGWGENEDFPATGPSSIASVGGGFRWYAAENIFSEIYYGFALNDIDHLDNDLQDYGFHFNFRWQFI